MIPSSETGRLLFPGPGTALGRAAPWRLSWYILWRVVGALVVLFVFLTLVFYVVEVVPLDPARLLLPRGGGCSPGSPACPPSIINQWGLDKPLFDRYVIFLTNILTGNLGVSLTYRFGVPVWDLIAPVLPMTLAFVAVTMLLLALLSLPLGLRMGRRKGRAFDTIASFLLALPFAVPTAMLGLIAVYLFAFLYPVFPLTLQRTADPLSNLANELWYDVLPELAILGTTVGLFAWVVRDHPLRPEEDLRPPPPGEWRSPNPPLSARVMGAIPRFLAAVPILFPWTLGGVLVGEMVFNINGAGLLLWTAIARQDFFLLIGVVVVLVLLILIPVLLVADILHYWMTARWDRGDAASVDGFRVDVRDPLRVLRKILTSVLGLVGIALILTMVIMSVAAPLLVGPNPTRTGLARPFLPPSPNHLLGTDESGRDLLTVLIYGGQSGIAVAIFGFALALVAEFAVVAGIGFFGERATVFLTLPVDLFLVLSIPFALLLVVTVGRDSAVWAPALLGWPVATRLLLLETTRIVPESPKHPRSKLSIHERGRRFLNLFWGTGALVLADAFLAVSLSILAWAIFGFLGLGPAGPGTVESWGEMEYAAYVSLAMLRGMWWYFVPPILFIFLAVLGPTLLSLQLKRIGIRRSPSAGPPVTVVQVTSVPPPSQVE
jgi:peptide/nickel transport system permease protein